MKKIFYVLSVLLLSLMFIGGVIGGAYALDVQSITIDDTDDLVPGQEVTVTVNVKIPDEKGVRFDSDLEKLTWISEKSYYQESYQESGKTIEKLSVGGTKVIKRGSYSIMPIEGHVPSDYLRYYTLSITVTGKVKSSDAGKHITILTITQDPLPTGEIPYKTKPQYVNDPSDFSKKALEIEAEISKLRTLIPNYQKYNVSTKTAESYLISADLKITSAKSAYNSHDNVDAFNSLAQAKKYVDNAKKSIAGYAITRIDNKCKNIEDIYTQLKELGETSKAAILISENDKIREEYKILSNKYQANGVPDAYNCLVKADNLETEAMKYLEDATKNPLTFLLDHWWILLIIAGVGVIVSVVIILIRRRNNSWDELG